MKHCSLYELNSLVQHVIQQSLSQQYWVEAELADVSERRGHLYLDLVEKDESSNTPIARAAARCWANVWTPIRMHFERVTGQQLRSGMKVLLCVRPQFHQAYGFSWIVTDIDPTFTLGDMARRRQEIVRQLKEEGVFDLQKELTLPVFCQRIAVISSQSAAGYGDFCNQLADNEYGFTFHTRLFPAIMQGEQVEPSVIAALDSINSMVDDFDCVVIIRGGGATTDMSGFDTLLLAENVANFPLPIITGIGHDRDECILDMVSHTRVKTPTAAAAYLISHLADVWDTLNDCGLRITQCVSQRLKAEQIRLTAVSTRLPMLFSLVKTRETARIDQIMQRLTTGMQQQVSRERHGLELLTQRMPTALAHGIESRRHHLELLAQRTASLDPQLILNRGYSMTMSAGKVITDASQLIDGEILETRLANGTAYSKVVEVGSINHHR